MHSKMYVCRNVTRNELPSTTGSLSAGAHPAPLDPPRYTGTSFSRTTGIRSVPLLYPTENAGLRLSNLRRARRGSSRPHRFWLPWMRQHDFCHAAAAPAVLLPWLSRDPERPSRVHVIRLSALLDAYGNLFGILHRRDGLDRFTAKPDGGAAGICHAGGV